MSQVPEELAPAGTQALRAWLLLNNNRSHTYNQNTDDDTEEDKTDGVCVFQKLEGIFLGFTVKHRAWGLLNGPFTFGRGPVS